MTTTATSMLVLAAGKTEARGKKLEGVAYGGALIRVPGWGLVGIDLSGLEIPAQVPLLAAHGGKVADVVGFGQALTKGRQLLVSGQLVLTTDAAKDIHELAQAGFAWQLSVGIEAVQYEYVQGGTSKKLNGQTVKAEEDWQFVSRGRLREISILPIGADADTAVKIAAASTGRAHRRGDMPGKVEDKEGIEPVEQQRIEAAAETERIAGIRKVCGGEHTEIAVKAIKAGWTVEQAELAALRAKVAGHELEALRAARPPAPAVSGQSHDEYDAHGARPDVLAAALLGHWGHMATAEKAFGPRVLEEAHGLHARCLADICAQALRSEFRDVPRSPSAIIRAAFSTTALSVALGSTADKLVLQGFGDTEPTWRGFANIVSVKDFKTAKVIRPSFSGELEELPSGGAIAYGLLEETTSDLSAKVYAQVIGVSYQSMVNDDASVFSQTAQQLGQNAARRVADVVYEAVLGNAGSFFHADNNNLLTGAGSALSVSALGDAIAAMLTQRDSNGRDLDIRAALLLVPPELREAGLQIVQSESLARYVSASLDNLPEGNPFKGLTLAVEPRLSNTVRFANASTTAWYLLARPSDAALNLAFLDGAQTPQIEMFGPSDEVDHLGYRWRVYISVGAALGDYRAAIKSAGA